MIKFIKNVYYYLQGNIRYKLFYSNFMWLLPQHIVEQIQARIDSMDRACYDNGQCKMCGCSTTALQMANKACDKPCYPPMLNKELWNRLKEASDAKYTKVGIKFREQYWFLTGDNKFFTHELERE